MNTFVLEICVSLVDGLLGETFIKYIMAGSINRLENEIYNFHAQYYLLKSGKFIIDNRQQIVDSKK